MLYDGNHGPKILVRIFYAQKGSEGRKQTYILAYSNSSMYVKLRGKGKWEKAHTDLLHDLDGLCQVFPL